jgi:hypothetical protein
MPSDLMDLADLKTLALARPHVTQERLDQFIAYQRHLLSAASLPLDRAHAQALEASGLPSRELPAVMAVCREFAGQRSTAQTVRERQYEARARGDEETADSFNGQLQRLHAPLYWHQRYGEELTGLLEGREDELVALHRALEAVELRRSTSAE